MPEDPAYCRIRVTYKGRNEEIEGSRDESILGAVLDHGIPVPFSCQTGTCLACNAVILDGEVKMKDSPALSSRMKDRGVVLTCSATPCSKFVWISYDD